MHIVWVFFFILPFSFAFLKCGFSCCCPETKSMIEAEMFFIYLKSKIMHKLLGSQQTKIASQRENQKMTKKKCVFCTWLFEEEKLEHNHNMHCHFGWTFWLVCLGLNGFLLLFWPSLLLSVIVFIRFLFCATVCFVVCC